VSFVHEVKQKTLTSCNGDALLLHGKVTVEEAITYTQRLL